jgi:hypothetical protein
MRPRAGQSHARRPQGELAVAVSAWFGTAGTGTLMILSQVILGLQLPFAVVPLLWFMTSRGRTCLQADDRSSPMEHRDCAGGDQYMGYLPIDVANHSYLQRPRRVATRSCGFDEDPALRLLLGSIPVGEVHRRALLFQTMPI